MTDEMCRHLEVLAGEVLDAGLHGAAQLLRIVLLAGCSKCSHYGRVVLHHQRSELLHRGHLLLPGVSHCVSVLLQREVEHARHHVEGVLVQDLVIEVGLNGGSRWLLKI